MMEIPCINKVIIYHIITVVTLYTFTLGKLDLLTVSPGKLNFLKVTDFAPGNLPRGNFIIWDLENNRFSLDSYSKGREREN